MDEREAARFLAERFGGVEQVEQLGGGDWSRAYGFRHNGAGYVSRFGAFEEDFAKDRLAAAFASPALPVPRVVEMGEAFGGFYCISERVYGAFLDNLDAAGLRRVLPSLLRALDAARTIDLSATSGFGLWHADGTGEGSGWRAWLRGVGRDDATLRTHGWREQLAASSTGDGPFEEAYRAMTALLPRCPERRHLVHCDLLHFNVLVSNGQISGVFDWGCSLYGDFLYDIAWLSFCLLWFPAWRGIDFALEARRHYAAIGLDVPDFAARLRCYELHIGLASQAYNAFRQRWTDLDTTARHTLALARAPID